MSEDIPSSNYSPPKRNITDTLYDTSKSTSPIQTCNSIAHLPVPPYVHVTSQFLEYQKIAIANGGTELPEGTLVDIPDFKGWSGGERVSEMEELLIFTESGWGETSRHLSYSAALEAAIKTADENIETRVVKTEYTIKTNSYGICFPKHRGVRANFSMQTRTLL